MNLNLLISEAPKLFALAVVMMFGSLQLITAGSPQIDLVLINGKIWTGNQNQPFAQAVVVSGKRIFFVGDNDKARQWIQPTTQVIDLQNRLLLPGFNDTHLHFGDGGFSLIELNLRNAKDVSDFTHKLGEYAQKLPSGAWITGGNWDHEAWPVKEYPNRWLIDSVTQNHPVLIYRLDGHVALANSLALKIAGIDKNTPDSEGGFIQKQEKTGEPTGILKDNATSLVYQHIPAPPDSVRLLAIQAALRHAAELGVTSVQDMSATADFPFYQQLLRQNQLNCRILAAMPIEEYANRLNQVGVQFHFGDAMLRIGSVKTFVDGSMGAGSALFFEPYNDDPTTSGLGIYPKKRLMELIATAHKNNLQICTHAIGDKANRWALDAYEAAIEQFGANGLRHRIEHAQVVTASDLPRFAFLNVIASIQPSHCIDDMRWAEKRIGKERCANAYRFKSLYDAGAHVAFGTDWPVEPLNPMLGIYAAVTREFPEGGPVGGWFPQEKISLEQALRSYTLESAYAEYEEANKGTIEVGKLADLVVLDHDLFTIPAKEILTTRVVMTILGGRIIYKQ